MGRLTVQAVGIFIVSLIVLFVVSVLSTANSHKASGMAYYNFKGIMFMILGGLYFVFGLVLSRWDFR